MPGRPSSAPHVHRRHDGVGEILGEALDGRARDACFIERARVAADDLGHGFAPSFDATLVERIGNGSDMLIEAPLGDQRAGEAGENDKRERRRKLQCDVLGDERRKHGRGEQQGKRDPAVATPFSLGQAWVVQLTLEAIEQGADPHDRMLDAVEQRRRIAEPSLDQACADDGDEIERQAHGSL